MSARAWYVFVSPSCPAGAAPPPPLLLPLPLLPSPASAPRTEACKDMHAFCFNVSAGIRACRLTQTEANPQLPLQEAHPVFVYACWRRAAD